MEIENFEGGTLSGMRFLWGNREEVRQHRCLPGGQVQRKGLGECWKFLEEGVSVFLTN